MSGFVSRRECAYCPRIAPAGMEWGCRANEFGPVPMCDHCAPELAARPVVKKPLLYTDTEESEVA